MLSQLVKHEFKATGRIVPFVYLMTAAMAVMNYLTARIGIRWLFTTTMIFLILLAVSEVIVTYVLVVSRYYKNLYSNEGYLMHTLPVRSRNLLISKALVSFVWLSVSYLVVLGVVVTIMASIASENHQTLSQVFKMVLAGSGLSNVISVPALMTVIVVYVILTIGSVLAQLFFAITLGNSARFHKWGIAGPILVFLATYFVQQLLSLVFIAFFPLGVHFNTNPAGQLTELKLVGEGMFGQFFSSTQSSGVIGLGSILLMVLATIGLFAATDRIMVKHTSLR